jgi:hypothetical protein
MAPTTCSPACRCTPRLILHTRGQIEIHLNVVDMHASAV